MMDINKLYKIDLQFHCFQKSEHAPDFQNFVNGRQLSNKLCSTDTSLSPWIRPGYVSRPDTYRIRGGYVSNKYPIFFSNKSNTRADPYWVTIAHHWIRFGLAQMLTQPPAAVHGVARRDNSVAAPGRERSEGRGKGERGAGGNSVVPSSTRSPVAAGLPLTTPTWGDRVGEALVEEEVPGRSWWQRCAVQGRRRACGAGEACVRAALGRRWAEQGRVRHKYEV
jgi:hypothetical protein